MIRVVLDTNLLVSALGNPRGAPAKILESWRLGDIAVVSSEAILDEVRRVMEYPKVRKFLHLKAEEIEGFIDELREFCLIVPGDLEVSVIEEDHSDDKFLACALEGEAEFIISGDKHLKSLREYRGVQVLSPNSFLAILKTQSR